LLKKSQLFQGKLITDGTHQTPTYSDSGYIFLSSTNVTTGKIDWNNVKYIPESLHRQLYSRLAPQKGDILLAKNGTTGVAALVDRDCEFDIYVSLALLRPKRELILPEYMLYAINNKSTKRKFDSQLKGIGVPNLHLKHIREVTIPLPPIDTQKSIVKICNQILSLLEKQKIKAIEFGNLIKSIFYDMFGDPFENNNKMNFSDICLLNPKKSELTLANHEIVSFIPMQNVSENGEIDTSETRSLRDVKNGFTYFRENDVLFAKITPCMENGKGAIARNLVNGIGFGSTEFHVLRPIEGISTSEWLYHLTTLPEFRKLAESHMTGSAGQKRVPASFFNNLKISVPPLELQQCFAEIVTKIEEQKALVKKAIEETQTLFDSLMSKYFDD